MNSIVSLARMLVPDYIPRIYMVPMARVECLEHSVRTRGGRKGGRQRSSCMQGILYGVPRTLTFVSVYILPLHPQLYINTAVNVIAARVLPVIRNSWK